MVRQNRMIYVLTIVLVLVFSSALEAASLSALFKKVSSSVVVIETMERRYSVESPGEEVSSASVGTGVIVSEDGLILTAAHVVHVADEVTVKLMDGRKVKASVLGSVDSADVAVIKMDLVPRDISVAKLGDSDKAATGDEVFVIGTPHGIEHTLTVGHISGRRIIDTMTSQMVPIEYLQTDAAVNPGNSGGPMFNMKGEVVGIVSHILTHAGGFEGIGYAVTINIAKELFLEQNPFYVGIEFYFASGDLAEALNIPQDTGLLIQRVANKSLGEKLGLRPGQIPVTYNNENLFIGGDIILEVQGVKISTNTEEMNKLQALLSEVASKGDFQCKIMRGGQIIDITTKQ